jgi:general secretion pathway protein G
MTDIGLPIVAPRMPARCDHRNEKEKKMNRSRSRRGFTLMEVLLVLVILMILGSLVVVSYRQVQKGALKRAAKIQIEMLEEGLELYQLNIRRYPTEEDGGLHALNQPPNGDAPYLKDPIPLDPWDNEYNYELLDEDNYRIWSNGPDGISDTEDDISSDVALR